MLQTNVLFSCLTHSYYNLVLIFEMTLKVLNNISDLFSIYTFSSGRWVKNRDELMHFIIDL